MAEVGKLYELIEQDSELRAKLEGMWKKGTTAPEIVDTLAKAGFSVDADQVEEALKDLQEKHGQVIGLEHVDAEQLKKIAGGQKTIDDCSDQFKDTEWWDHGAPDFCTFYNVCDDFAMMNCAETSNRTW